MLVTVEIGTVASGVVMERAVKIEGDPSHPVTLPVFHLQGYGCCPLLSLIETPEEEVFSLR